jgi:hypothetical protein
MTTLEIEIALLKHFDFTQKLILPRISFGAGIHECDILVMSKSGYATEIEIKISVADLKKDLNKKHTHNSDKIKYFYYAIPKEMYDYNLLNFMKDCSGLLLIDKVPKIRRKKNKKTGDVKVEHYYKYTVEEIRIPVANKNPIK